MRSAHYPAWMRAEEARAIKKALKKASKERLGPDELRPAAEVVCLNIMGGRPGVIKNLLRAAAGLNGFTRESRILGLEYHSLGNYISKVLKVVREPALAAASAAGLRLLEEGVIRPIVAPNPENMFSVVCSCGKAFRRELNLFKHIKRAHRRALENCVQAVVSEALTVLTEQPKSQRSP